MTKENMDTNERTEINTHILATLATMMLHMDRSADNGPEDQLKMWDTISTFTAHVMKILSGLSECDLDDVNKRVIEVIMRTGNMSYEQAYRAFQHWFFHFMVPRFQKDDEREERLYAQQEQDLSSN